MLLSFSGCKCRDFFGLSKFSGTFFAIFVHFSRSHTTSSCARSPNKSLINRSKLPNLISCAKLAPENKQRPRLQKIRRTLLIETPKTEWTDGPNPRKVRRKCPESTRSIRKIALRYPETGTKTARKPRIGQSSKDRPAPEYDALIPTGGDVSFSESANRNITKKSQTKRRPTQKL